MLLKSIQNACSQYTNFSRSPNRKIVELLVAEGALKFREQERPALPVDAAAIDAVAVSFASAITAEESADVSRAVVSSGSEVESELLNSESASESAELTQPGKMKKARLMPPLPVELPLAGPQAASGRGPGVFFATSTLL